MKPLRLAKWIIIVPLISLANLLIGLMLTELKLSALRRAYRLAWSLRRNLGRVNLTLEARVARPLAVSLKLILMVSHIDWEGGWR